MNTLCGGGGREGTLNALHLLTELENKDSFDKFLSKCKSKNVMIFKSCFDKIERRKLYVRLVKLVARGKLLPD